MGSTAKCQLCQHCKCLQKTGNIRKKYYCRHPNQKYIEDYFKEHNIQKMPGFLGFAKFNDFPVKNTPKWCPFNSTKRYTSTLNIYEPNIFGKYDTEPYVYMYKGAEKMSNEDFNNLITQCVEIERIAEGTTLFVEVRTEYDGKYLDGDDYEITVEKVVLSDDELSSYVDWEKCSPKLPKIYAVKEIKLEVNVQ